MENISVGLLELETAVLECFLEKTPLSPLGVKGLKQWTLDPCKILDYCMTYNSLKSGFNLDTHQLGTSKVSL
jgi:hypothetical protein